MIGDIVLGAFSFLRPGSAKAKSEGDIRRKYVRYNSVQAEVVVGQRAYSIRDWSLGGVSFETPPDARLTSGDRIEIELKFRFAHGTVTVRQPAEVVRAVRRDVAAKFTPLGPGARREFSRVFDVLNAEGFLASQTA